MQRAGLNTFEEVWVPEGVVPLGQVLLRSAARAPDDRAALVFPEARFTCRELSDRAWPVARAQLRERLLAELEASLDHAGALS